MRCAAREETIPPALLSPARHLSLPRWFRCDPCKRVATSRQAQAFKTRHGLRWQRPPRPATPLLGKAHMFKSHTLKKRCRPLTANIWQNSPLPGERVRARASNLTHSQNGSRCPTFAAAPQQQERSRLFHAALCCPVRCERRPFAVCSLPSKPGGFPLPGERVRVRAGNKTHSQNDSPSLATPPSFLWVKKPIVRSAARPHLSLWKSTNWI